MSDVILLSGGIESCTLLHKLHTSHELHPLFIDYGQRAGKQEYRAALHHCKLLGLTLKKLDMAQTGHDFRAGQSKKLHVPLPHRNLVALSLGLSYATQIGANRLLLALNREDTQSYPSASETFIAKFRAMAEVLGDIELAVPLCADTKAQIIQQGHLLGVDYSQTYSCLLGHAQHCGHCPQCLHRREAFRQAEIQEPNGFYRA
ncbi:MAG: 7-cyano-7-deazaguanine synthase [Sulfuriferula sp.]|nr:7-cyano-7-deazaguanine synthase [Sulfuriferula sp.]